MWPDRTMLCVHVVTSLIIIITHPMIGMASGGLQGSLIITIIIITVIVIIIAVVVVIPCTLKYPLKLKYSTLT